MKTRILSLALALALSLSLAAPALAVYETPTFTDVSKSHWAYTYVEQAAEKKWIAGNPNGTFAPNANVSYAQFCVMLVSAFYQDRLAGYTGPSSPWYAPYCGTAAQLGLFNYTGVRDKHTDGAVMNSPINRYEMAGMLYATLGTSTSSSSTADYDAVKASTPEYDSIPLRYKTPVAVSKTYGIISGVDNTGNFGGTGNMTRAQAAVVLCKANEVIQADPIGPRQPVTPTQPEEPTETEKPTTQPSGNYGPVGTMSDTPVTLSLETHKPVHDHWSQQSAEIRNMTDKDNFNAAVQTMRDVEMILTEGEFGTSYRDRTINFYYNYAMADSTAMGAENIWKAISDTALRGHAYGNYAYMMGARNNIYTIGKATDSDQLAEVFAPIFARFPANATDKQKVDICVQEIVDRFDYATGTSGFTWLNGGTSGTCESYYRVASQILSAAGIPTMQIGGMVFNGAHAWNLVYVDGAWCVVDATAAEYGYPATMTFAEHENLYGYSHATNNTDSIKIAKALVEASLS